MVFLYLAILKVYSNFLSQTGHVDLWMSDSTMWHTGSFATEFKSIDGTFFFCLLRLFEILRGKKKILSIKEMYAMCITL